MVKSKTNQNIIGLDISKDTIDCHLIRKGKSIEDLKITNNEGGYQTFDHWLKAHKIRKTAVSMEATGIYYQAIAKHLSQNKSNTVYVINPLKIKTYADSHFVKTKTDKSDARLIADYTQRHQDKLVAYKQPTDSQHHLKQLYALKHQIKLQIKQTKNRIHASKDSNFVQDIYQDLLIMLNDKLKLIVSEIKQNQNNAKNLLSTISGIGEDTAYQIQQYLETKDFATANKFVAYAGLNPAIKQSGISVSKKEKSGKYGNRRLKALFFYPALVAYRNQAFPRLVRNLEANKKPKMVIITAIMRKLAKLAYIIHKTQQPFDKSRYQIA